jgi:hypothetical protein
VPRFNVARQNRRRPLQLWLFDESDTHRNTAGAALTAPQIARALRGVAKLNNPNRKSPIPSARAEMSPTGDPQGFSASPPWLR